MRRQFHVYPNRLEIDRSAVGIQAGDFGFYRSVARIRAYQHALSDVDFRGILACHCEFSITNPSLLLSGYTRYRSVATQETIKTGGYYLLPAAAGHHYKDG